MAAGGQARFLQRAATRALALVGAAAGVLMTAADVSADSRSHKYSRQIEQQSREARRAQERQQREQARASERALKEAQKAAERNARQQQKILRETEHASGAASRGGADLRAGSSGFSLPPTAGRAPTPTSKTEQDDGAGRKYRERHDADAPDDDDDYSETHPAIDAATRRIEAIEALRREAVNKAVREHDAWRQKDIANSHSARNAREPRVPWAKAERPPAVPAWATNVVAPQAPEAARQSPEARAAAVIAAGRAVGVLPKPDAERPVKWLDGFQRQASHLGMGAALVQSSVAARAVAGATKPERGEKQVQQALPLSEQGSSELRRAIELPFRGKERGAELPPDLFERARDAELVVTGISPVDLETAKLHGFVASDPTVLEGSGQVVRRLVGPLGTSRDKAERELHKILPFLQVTPNQAYTIYMGSLGETDSASSVRPSLERSKVVPASPHPCPSETCFGAELIKWKRALRTCTKGVRIGVIDTSFDMTHPALTSVRAEQGEFLDGQAASPFDWHGTAVLSLLAGDPASGTPGLVPDATFLLATAFRSDAAGNASTDTVRLLAALAWLDRRGAEIVNMSFSGPQDPAVERAIGEMRRKGVVFIAAAGNMGPTAGPSYPAAYPDVIAVTAINREGNNYRNANRGDYVDVSAPGVDILTALPGAKQGYRTGTSFAAPFVTAILATRGARWVQEVGLAQAFKPAALKQLAIRDLGPPGRDPIYGAGLALAPESCQRREDGVADASPTVPDLGWTAGTTLIKAGAAGILP